MSLQTNPIDWLAVAEKILPWMGGTVLAAISYFVGRRVQRSTAGNLDANSGLVQVQTNSALWEQLKQIQAEIPIWRSKLEEQETKSKVFNGIAAKCEKVREELNTQIVSLTEQLDKCRSTMPLDSKLAEEIKAHADVIAENMAHLTFIPAEGETIANSVPFKLMVDAKDAAKALMEKLK